MSYLYRNSGSPLNFLAIICLESWLLSFENVNRSYTRISFELHKLRVWYLWSRSRSFDTGTGICCWNCGLMQTGLFRDPRTCASNVRTESDEVDTRARRSDVYYWWSLMMSGDNSDDPPEETKH